MDFPGGWDSKASVYNAGDPGSIRGLGRSPGEGKATHSSILAWKIPWTEEPGRLQSMGLQRVRHNWATSLSLSLLDSMEIKLVNPKGKQPWILTGKPHAEAEAPILWPTDVESWLIGKDPDAGKDWRQGKIESTKMNEPQILRIKALFLFPLISSLPVFNPSASWAVSTSKI